jgi:hypothetical protein
MLPLMTLNNCQITKCKRQKTPTSKAKFLKFQGKCCNLTVSKSNQRLKSLDQNLIVVNGNKVIILFNKNIKKLFNLIYSYNNQKSYKKHLHAPINKTE